MRKLILSIFTVTILVSIAFAQNGKIKVDIFGIETIEGQLAIGLYNESDNFPDVSKAYKSTFLEVTDENMTYIFSGIPNGEYAIALFHDSNNSGKLDKNFIGIPKEGYGFSKNVTGTFGPPHFGEAKFKLDSSYTAKIRIKY